MNLIESILSKYSDDTVLAILHVLATIAMLLALSGFAAAYWAYFV
jgi:hypothetical protein